METLEKRVKICRLVEKMRKYPDFGQHLTLKDQSGFRAEEAISERSADIRQTHIT